MEPVETYEYLFYGRPKAIFVIAALELEAVRVLVIDETGGPDAAARGQPRAIEIPRALRHARRCQPRCRRWRTSAAWTSLKETMMRADIGTAAADTTEDAGSGTASPAPVGARGSAEIRKVEIEFVTNAGKTVSAPANSNLLRVSLREQGGIPFKCWRRAVRHLQVPHRSRAGAYGRGQAQGAQASER